MSNSPRAAAPSPTDLLGVRSMLSEEERAITDTVRKYVESEITPHAGQWFEDGTFPDEIIPTLGEMGLLGMHLEGYGCAGTNAVSYGLACRELEAGDSGLRSFVSVQGSLAMFPIWKYGSEEQKQQWLPDMAAGKKIGCFGLTEPDHGSDPGHMSTRAKKDGSDWIINGAKMWITNGPIADVAVVWADTEEGVRGFVVPTDTPGFTANEIKHKGSLRMSKTGELVFDNLRLPADAVLPEVKGLRGPLSCLSEARFGILFGALGAGRSCYETARDYAASRIQFGKPIGGFQLTQQKLVKMAMDLAKGELLALHLGRLKDSDAGLAPEQVSFGKLNNVRVSIDAARTARTILGGNGISHEYPLMRHANNLESVLTYEGTEEVHTLVLGQLITGQNAFS
ncbi:glutaryl-CoA dehydrogenase [Antricoccus suffuscus]|uniref:Glutaryl-CoA dehydrogenase n=1 Tax=Antricoccus suffuscus TaxID=1629062 RepID=A0A2T1A314_9ACTN|nr:acyl-CoA dehydrogenase family protein [Antricoccus suffuscus]PRZ43001.1 glutaryl-CoA dehydrogenase [Antricoccus suffuscus]